MVQHKSIKRFLVLLLQLLGPLHDKILNLLILAVELGGKRLFPGDKVFLLSIEQNTALPLGGFILGGLCNIHLLGILDVSLLQEEHLPALAHFLLASL